MRLSRAHSDRQVDLALVVLRLIAGATFIAHGAQKLFVFGLDGVGAGFAQMGVPFAALAGPLVGLLEFFGGMALVLGLLTRPVALGLGFTMIGAIWFVHLPNGFFLPNGVEFVLALLGIAIALVLTGAGSYSVDARLATRGVARAPALPAPHAVKDRKAA
ncbi:MAG TPA: DoxX family protein [Gemmatimonadaceae bacterium]|nr:DoxX family protein [Gemmatimonadaceae bacterium]